jgi:hypothetical protein
MGAQMSKGKVKGRGESIGFIGYYIISFIE